MPEFIKEPIRIKREVEVEITPQALRILKQSKVEVEKFLDFCLVENKISFGGHNVMLYLEKQYVKEAENK